jgi:hypothetical protein
LKLLIHKSHGLRKKISLTEKSKEEQMENKNSS